METKEREIMGKPTKNAFNGGGRPTDMSKSPSANIQPRGGMTPDAYQAMKVDKRRNSARKRLEKALKKKGKQ